MEIRYYRKSVYGNTLIYIDEPSNYREAIYGLTGRKSLLKKDMDYLMELGFTFKEVIAP